MLRGLAEALRDIGLMVTGYGIAEPWTWTIVGLVIFAIGSFARGFVHAMENDPDAR